MTGLIIIRKVDIDEDLLTRCFLSYELTMLTVPSSNEAYCQ